MLSYVSYVQYIVYWTILIAIRFEPWLSNEIYTLQTPKTLRKESSTSRFVHSESVAERGQPHCLPQTLEGLQKLFETFYHITVVL